MKKIKKWLITNMPNYSSITWILLIYSIPTLLFLVSAPILGAADNQDSTSAMPFFLISHAGGLKVAWIVIYVACPFTLICLITLIARQLREHIAGKWMRVGYLTLFRPIWLSFASFVLFTLTINFLLHPPIGWLHTRFVASNLNSLCEVAVGLSLAFTLLDGARDYARKIVNRKMDMLKDPTFTEVFESQMGVVLAKNKAIASIDKKQDVDAANKNYQEQAQILLTSGVASLTDYAKLIGIITAFLFLGLLSWLAAIGGMKFIHASMLLGVIAAIVFPAGLHFLMLMSIVRHANEKFTDVFHIVLPDVGRGYAIGVRKDVVSAYKDERAKLDAEKLKD